MRRQTLGVVIAAGLLAAGLAVTACGGADKADYAKANQAILDQLPTYSGSTVESHTDNPYYLTEQGPVSGYTTNVVYRVSGKVTDDDVIGFYIEQLGDGWQHCTEDVPIRVVVPADASPSPQLGTVKLARFFRLGAGVSINTTALNPGNTYEIAVDHEAISNPCTGEDLK